MKRLCLVLSILVLFGCATAQKIGERKLTSEKGDKGEWITDLSLEDTREGKAFTGVSHDFSNEADARNDALKNARAQIVDAMGVYGKRKVQEVITHSGVASDIIDPGLAVQDMTELISESYVKARAKKYYIQEYNENTSVGIKTIFKAYVLVFITNAEIDEQVKETIKKKTNEIKDEKDKKNIDSAIELMEKMETDDWSK